MIKINTQYPVVYTVSSKKDKKGKKEKGLAHGYGQSAGFYGQRKKIPFHFLDDEQRIEVIDRMNEHPKLKSRGFYIELVEKEIVLKKKSDTSFHHLISDEQLNDWDNDLKMNGEGLGIGHILNVNY